MIRNILFDFDGVILDSMKIKGDGFMELFKEYEPKYLNLLEQFHYANGGISRFEKIKYFFNVLLEKKITEEKVLEYANKFSNIIHEKLFDKSNLIRETIDFIELNYKNYNLHIVSGAEHKELNSICTKFKLNKYFLSIEGSPTKKVDLVKYIIIKKGYLQDETILIGDSINDYEAAKNNEIKFYGFNNLELKKFNYINSFNEFSL